MYTTIIVNRFTIRFIKLICTKLNIKFDEEVYKHYNYYSINFRISYNKYLSFRVK